jgi:hypothetical protein
MNHNELVIIDTGSQLADCGVNALLKGTARRRNSANTGMGNDQQLVEEYSPGCPAWEEYQFCCS